MKDYSLVLQTSVLEDTAFLADLSDVAQNWIRSTRGIGGYWEGTFTVTSGNLREAFERWLGGHLVERSGGGVVWEGIIYEMELSYKGVVRRKSLLDMVDAIDVQYRVDDYTGANLVLNSGFENWTGLNLDDWTMNSGGAGPAGSITQWVGQGRLGSDCVRIQTGNGEGSGDPWGLTPPNVGRTWISQDIDTVEAGRKYQLSLWERHAAPPGYTDPGWYAIEDTASSSWVIAPTCVGGDPGWTNTTTVFTAPASGEITLYLWGGPATWDDTAWDDVEITGRGSEVARTGWIKLDEAITRYGRKEEMLPLDSCLEDTARAAGASFLGQFGWPPTDGVNFGQGRNSLSVTVVGYIQTANWLFFGPGNGAQGNLSAWIEAIVGSTFGLSYHHGGTDVNAGDCQFLRTGNIATNTLQVFGYTSVDVRVWDVLAELMLAGIDVGGVQTPVVFQCGKDRRVHYGAANMDPIYHWQNGRLHDINGKPITNARLVRPGVVRDLTYPFSHAPEGSIFSDSRDIWIEEVEVDSEGNLTLKPAAFNVSAVLEKRGEFEAG